MLHRRTAVALALVALVLSGALPADAQERIPQETITRTGVMNDSDNQALSAFLNRWVGVLESANTNPDVADDAISEARDRLISPVRTPGVTDLFKFSYSRATSKKLLPLLKSERLVIRLNAMIIATRLTDESVLDLGLAGLKDEAPSVRYWAATSIGTLAKAVNSAGKDVLPTKTKLQVLRDLGDMGAEEESAEVLQKVLEAMAGMDLPSAPKRVMDLLSDRLKYHVNRPYEPYLAETGGLFAVFKRLLDQSVRSTVDPADVRTLAGLSQRYMNLISKNLAEAKELAKAEGSENPINPQLEADHGAMLDLCDKALQFSHDQLKSPERMPESISSMIQFDQWDKINKIAVAEWGAVLLKPPFSFTPADLAIINP